MKITVDIPEKIADQMLGSAEDAGHGLLELAGFAACEAGRISERQLMELLHLESIFDVHDLLKTLDRARSAVADQIIDLDQQTMRRMEELRQLSKAG